MKKIGYILIFLIPFFIGITKVNASRSVCVYKVGKSTVTINYDSTKTPQVNISNGKADSATDFRKVEKVENLKNSDFVNNGTLICPKLNATSRKPYEKNKFKLTLSSSGEAKYGSFSGVLSILENDGAENGGVIKIEKIECVYKKGTTKSYTLRWENGRVVAELTGTAYANYCKGDTTIKQEGFSAEDFKNGKCPDVYESEVNKHQSLGGGCKGKLVISKNSIMTENDAITKNDNEEENKTQTAPVSNTKFDFCNEDGILKTFQIVNYLITLIKVLVPLLLIIFGAVDFAKAMMAGDEKGIQSAAKMLAYRAVAGVIIFFIPTIFNLITSLISKWQSVESNFKNCSSCLLDSASKCEKTRKSLCKSDKDKTCSWNAGMGSCECTEK